MGQVADMGALALDGLLVVVQQPVDLFRQGLDLHRINPGDPGRPALADIGDLVPQGEQGTQADLDLQEDGDDQPQAQNQEGRPGEGGELARVIVDVGAVDPGHEHHRGAPAGQLFHAGRDPQGFAARTDGVVADDLAGGGRQSGRQFLRNAEV